MNATLNALTATRQCWVSPVLGDLERLSTARSDGPTMLRNRSLRQLLRPIQPANLRPILHSDHSPIEGEVLTFQPELPAHFSTGADRHGAHDEVDDARQACGVAADLGPGSRRCARIDQVATAPPAWHRLPSTLNHPGLIRVKPGVVLISLSLPISFDCGFLAGWHGRTCAVRRVPIEWGSSELSRAAERTSSTVTHRRPPTSRPGGVSAGRHPFTPI